MSSLTTTTLEKPLESTTDNDDTPKMFHYVRKSKIARICGDGQLRGGAVRRDVPGDPLAQAGLAGVPGLQEDLRVAQGLIAEGLRSCRPDR